MDSQASSSPRLGPAPILGIVGGALLVAGSLMTWASVSFNIQNIANALGVDPSILPADTFGSASVTGSKVTDGKVALACGVIVVLAAVALLAVKGARVIAAVVVMVGGLAGGGIALYNGINDKQDAINEGVHQFTQAGVPGDAKSFFNVSIGIGIWICVVGGIAAIVAGIIALMQNDRAIAAPAAMGGTMDMGSMDGAGMPAPSGTAVPAAAPPAADTPAAETPTAPPPVPPSVPDMPSTPEPPPAPPTETPDAGGDATPS
jgi:hypothetical protein